MGVIATIIAGLIIGLLARLAVPGRQNFGLIVTTLIGIAGALIGRWLWTGPLGKADTTGIDWIQLFFSIGAAVVLVVLWGAVFGRGRK